MELNKVIAIPAIALAAGISLAACGSNSQPGYLNVKTLESSIASNKASSNEGWRVTCVPDGTTDEFACSETFYQISPYANGDTSTVIVNVAPDGSSWVSH